MTAVRKRTAATAKNKRAPSAKEDSAPSRGVNVELSAKLTVLTIGHSTRTVEEFLSILKAPLREQGIEYAHLKSLGGLRHPKKDSSNTGWRNASFRGYADYMATDEFRTGVEALMQLATAKRTAIMCAEAVPWRCHRSLIGDALLVRGVNVQDIMSATSARSHEMTPFAEVNGLEISYPADNPASHQANLPLS